MTSDLHLGYQTTRRLGDLLAAWDAGVAGEAPVAQHRWTDMAIWPAARSATVAGSTGIEGNPLSARQVDEILSGGRVEATETDIRDVLNYNQALDLSNRAALRPDFEWSEELLRRLNAAVLDGLPDDERGEYRSGPVTVGGVYAPPEHPRIPELMRQLVEWLNNDSHEHSLVRAGLTHLNVVSIHPWLNGNGRTARVAGSLMLMRRGVATPELVNIESYVRAHRDEYIDVLQHSHGSTYDPGQHSATEWLEYFARTSVDRLEVRNRIQAAVPGDIGLVLMELATRGQSTAWAPIVLAAAVAPIRTTRLASAMELSPPRLRAILGAMARAGWLRAEGRGRGRRYVAGDLSTGMRLRVPELMESLREGGPIPQ